MTKMWLRQRQRTKSGMIYYVFHCAVLDIRYIFKHLLEPNGMSIRYCATPSTFLIWNNLCDQVYQWPTKTYQHRLGSVRHSKMTPLYGVLVMAHAILLQYVITRCHKKYQAVSHSEQQMCHCSVVYNFAKC